MDNTTLSEQLLPFFKPTAEPLTNEQTLSVLKEKFVAYPEVIRCLTDTSCNEFVLLSFLKTAEHSYVKVRGYGTINECNEKAKTIVKNVDSRFPIAIAKLGQWAYVTSDPDKVSKETVNVIDDKEITHSEHVDILINEHTTRQMRNEKEKDKDIHTRAATLTTDQRPPLETFIYNKVKVYETNKQIEFLGKKLTLLKDRQALLKAIIQSDPQFEVCWLKEYKDQLLRVGIKESAITEDAIQTALNNIALPQIYTDTHHDVAMPLDIQCQLKKRLEEVENEYNNLRYAAVNF
jgi:uncharacterized protein DUF5832